MERAEGQKIVGVMGSGMIGTDPYAENAWSGSSRFFFAECARQGVLHRAFGVEVPASRKLPLMLRNFSPDRALWRRKFYLDTRYYDALSRELASQLGADDRRHTVLQIGGIYNLRASLGKGRLVSYHDGNLAQAMKSPQFARNVSQRRVQKALDFEREVYRNIDVVFTMSEYLKTSFVEDFGVDASRVENIGAGINLESFPAAPVNKDYDSKKLLFVGADFTRKGGPDLLKAFQKVRLRHPSAELHIIGPRELSIPAEVSAGVVNVGFLSKKDPDQRRRFEQIVAQSSLYVMPSIYEPFGIAPLEAMSNQIPAVLSNAWAFPEMVTPGVNGELVKTGDVDDMAEKIIALLDDPARLEAMGLAARTMVQGRFTWEAVVKKMRRKLSV